MYTRNLGLNDVEKRVKLGAEWLDRVYPGWERKIDLSKLNLDDGCNCIIGQTFLSGEYHVINGHLENGFNVLTDIVCLVEKESPGSWIYDRGFLSAFLDEDALLDEAWTRLIKDRFDTGRLSDLVF